MRLLIVDDDKEIREFLKGNFQSECFTVDTCADGEEGSFMARTHEYDAIILDNVMPKKNGYEVCREIRDAGKNTPVLMLSVQSDIEDKVDLIDIGADDYITKPFAYRELKSRLHALLRRPPTVLRPIMKVDDLTLDVAHQKVHRGKKEIYLTRKEFALTEYLMRNHGTVVSRGMLMEHVWNDDLDPFSNTIEAHILNLRKKLETSPTRKIIHTVPGRGYKIESKGRKIFN